MNSPSLPKLRRTRFFTSSFLLEPPVSMTRVFTVCQASCYSYVFLAPFFFSAPRFSPSFELVAVLPSSSSPGESSQICPRVSCSVYPAFSGFDSQSTPPSPDTLFFALFPSEQAPEIRNRCVSGPLPLRRAEIGLQEQDRKGSHEVSSSIPFLV